MPQIWLTYEEIGDMYGRSAVEGRDFAISAGLDRRKCSDGLSRAKLPDCAATAFMMNAVRDHLGMAANEPRTDVAAAPVRLSLAFLDGLDIAQAS